MMMVVCHIVCFSPALAQSHLYNHESPSVFVALIINIFTTSYITVACPFAVSSLARDPCAFFQLQWSQVSIPGH